MQYTNEEQHAALTEWLTEVPHRFPALAKPQATVLALWSFGSILAHSCGLTSVSVMLAALLDVQEHSMTQRLREWYSPAAHKAGKQRQELDVTLCFAPLLCWIVQLWPPQRPAIALAMDATTVKQRFTVLSVQVVYRGCAIPVAWKIVGATTKGAWNPHWTTLFDHLKDGIPAHWTVIMLSDRGLYSKTVFESIVAHGWHPFMRINRGGLYQRVGGRRCLPIRARCVTPESVWREEVQCFKRNTLRCTVVGVRSAGHADAWFIVTDLPPAQARVCWYGMRWGIECGFRDLKSDGWQWQRSRMTDPARAERVWLALALALLWAVSVGGDAEGEQPEPDLSQLSKKHIAHRTCHPRRRARQVSIFRRGVALLLTLWMKGKTRLPQRFWPEPWPKRAAPAPQTRVSLPLTPG